MTDKYLRKLAMAIMWEIDDSPLAKANKKMDDLKKRMGDGTAQRFGRDMSSAGTAVGSAGAAASRAASSVDKLNSSTRKASESMRLLKASAKGAMDVVSNQLDRVGSFLKGGAAGGAAAVTGTAAYLVGSGVGKALQYQAQLDSLQALTGVSDAVLKQLDDLAKAQGAETKYSALQALQAEEELVKQGMEPATVQAEGLASALNLAIAGGLNLTDTASYMSLSMSSFADEALKANRAADLMAGAANASAFGVRDLGQALEAGGGVFGSKGGTFIDFLTGAGISSKFAGIKSGAEAGTSLKTFMNRLTSSVDETRGLMDQLGIGNDEFNKFFDVKGDVKPLREVAGVLQDVFKGMNNRQRGDAFEQIFGEDGMRTAIALFKAGTEGVDEFQKELNKVTAKSVAKGKSDNALGAIEQFGGAVENLQIKAITPFLPFIEKTFDRAGAVIDRWSGRVVSKMEGVASYIQTRYVNNQAFRDLSVSGKIQFLFDDFKATFDTWYNSGGNDQISSATSALIGYVSDALSKSSPQLTAIGAQLGKSLASGMVQGLQEFAKENPEMAAILTFISTPGPLAAKAAAAVGVGTGILPEIVDKGKEAFGQAKSEYDVFKKDGFLAGLRSTFGNATDRFQASIPDVRDANGKRLVGKALIDWQRDHPAYGPPYNGSHAAGLNSVPFDGYRAELHYGERVLTAAENREYGGGMGRPVFYITVNGSASRGDVKSGVMDALDAWGASKMRSNPQTVVR